MSRQPWPWRSGYTRVGLLGLVKPEGRFRPKFYFFGYEDWEMEWRVFYPVGIHWLIKMKRDIIYFAKKFFSETYRHSIREQYEYIAYRRGRADEAKLHEKLGT